MTDKYYESENDMTLEESAEISDDDSTEENTVPYKLYLEEIQAKKIALNQDLNALYKKLLSGDSSVTEEILNSWLVRITEIATLYKSSPAQHEDLVQEGNMALWIALTEGSTVSPDDFDQHLESKVKEAMENHIREAAGDSDWMQAVLGKASLLHEATLYLEKENGATPSIEQLSEFTRITPEEIQNILSLYSKPE